MRTLLIQLHDVTLVYLAALLTGKSPSELMPKRVQCGGCGRDITGSTVVSPWGTTEPWCIDCKEI